MPENYKNFIEALVNDKALAEKFDVEKTRLLQEAGIESDADVVVKAAAALGFSLSTIFCPQRIRQFLPSPQRPGFFDSIIHN